MKNQLGVSWFDWLHDAGYTTGTIMHVSAEQHRQLRKAWHDCADPVRHRSDKEGQCTTTPEVITSGHTG